nr:hypothetical protein [Candidatus Sigynarchaeota archaeon]
MVMWPRACIGCGETDPQKLKDRAYTYSHRHPVSSHYVSSNVVETTYDVHSLRVNSYLCAPCESKAKGRYVGGLVGYGLLMAAGWAGFGIAGDEGDYELQTGLIPVAFIFSFIFFMWLGWRVHPETHYHKVRYNYRRQTFSFTFKNPKYEAIFKQVNPGEQSKVLQSFP